MRQEPRLLHSQARVTDVNARAWAFYRRLGLASAGTRQLVRPEEPDHWQEQLVRQLA